MNKIVTNLVFAVSFMFASMANATIILTLDPESQTTVIGETVSVTLMIEGLGDGLALSLSSYDLLIDYDSNALSFTGYNLFDDLGGPLDAEDWSFGDDGAGSVHLSEFSYLGNDELWDFQPSSFALFELFFTVDAPATSAVSLEFGQLWDVNGDVINVGEINNASVTGVPTPGTSILMGLALFTLFVRQKYNS